MVIAHDLAVNDINILLPSTYQTSRKHIVKIDSRYI